MASLARVDSRSAEPERSANANTTRRLHSGVPQPLGKYPIRFSASG